MIEIINTLLPIIGVIGGIIIAGSYVFTLWKQGGIKAGSEVITVYKTQVDQLREEQKSLMTKLDDQGNKISELQGIIKEKDRANGELKALLLDRNPEVEKFYKQALPVILDMQKFMKDMSYHLKDSNKELHVQTEELKHQSDVLEQKV